MAEEISSEAKSLQQGLKDSLRTRDPWDRDVEFQRKNLRRKYLQLLFAYPDAAESRDVETHLWMATSYQFISKYKERYADLDRSTRSQQPHVAERHRLLQRFRQFLSEEEKFWMQLIVRLRRVFALAEAERAFPALNILPDDTTATTEGPKRMQHQFPPEADIVAPYAAEATPARHQNGMARLNKALICLGDIERYKEQYNEAGGRPRAGHEDGPPALPHSGRGGRNRRSGTGRAGAGQASAMLPMPRMRDYRKAKQCYKQARLLFPHDGNAPHQLAILASYRKDTFKSLVYYYRALCVRMPYDTAAENMGTMLHKALEAWRATGGRYERVREHEEATGAVAPHVRAEAFKEKVVVLHAMWRFSPADDINRTLASFSERVVHEYKALINDLVIPIGMIWKVIMLAQGALWIHRSVRHPSGGRLGRGGAPSASSSARIEAHIAEHVLGLHRVLLDIGVVQIAEAPEDADQQHLAQRITATLRRILPALRLASKWVRANFKYLDHPRTFESGDQADASDSSGSRERLSHLSRDRGRRSYSLTIAGMSEFWQAYSTFVEALQSKFPLEQLPALTAVLKVDRKMVGFLPLKGFLSGDLLAAVLGQGTAAEGGVTVREGEHPNEEQLMMIHDLLTDARVLAISRTPLAYADGHFTLASAVGATIGLSVTLDEANQPSETNQALPVEAPTTVPMVQPVNPVQSPVHSVEDDNATETSHTDDDPIKDAFHEALRGSGGSDDEIVYDPGPPRPTRGYPVTPGHSKPTSPRRLAPISPPRGIPSHSSPSGGARPPGMTAEEILIGLQQANGHTRVPSVPQSQLLFGSATSGSIWSTGYIGTPSRFPATSSSTSYQSHDLPSPPSLMSSIPVQSRLPAATSTVPTHALFGAHHRASSLSIGSQGLLSQSSSQLYNYGDHATNASYTTGTPSAYMETVSSNSGLLPNRQHPFGHQSLMGHDARDARIGQGPTPLRASLSSTSQFWSNPG